MKTVFESEVEFKEKISFPLFAAIRIMLLISLGLNLFLFFSIWILEARISKLESKHVDSTPLKIKFGSE